MTATADVDGQSSGLHRLEQQALAESMGECEGSRIFGDVVQPFSVRKPTQDLSKK